MNEKLKIFHQYNERTMQYSSPAENNISATFFDKRIWVDTKEAANYLRISVGSLRNAVYRKQIIARKFRRRLYFKLSELNRLLDNSII
ncbi:MAG: helix-turn-helix domain-containing protein [Bacteriovoracaceae bacterium]|nr:helix-turn-helix domain-containing protein [Bacteriovoracaceae bacterium]